ncbi:DEAD/DEAH box helicase [Bacillus siamensis]|uniref:DEAD/DEAH box helicase n=1 Tax=Bacillus siamensis TaxID=659243 RepID=UPI0006472089|nr:DEAD/DEAH box helicase [Bacillus siamensis]QQD81618.1 DEAD/DEAH box helicase [Bacillus siamensis]
MSEDASEFSEVRDFFYGRHLLRSEIPFSDQRISPFIEKEYITAEPSVIRRKKRYVCRRCGQSEQACFAAFWAPSAKRHITYCRACVVMGRADELTSLYSWNQISESSWEPVKLAWEGTLTDGQKQAAGALIKAIKEKQELLVWAVCGSGKTEMLFPGIEFALNHGLRVCVATPRTDVVLELLPRLKKAFENVEVSALYGGSEEKGSLTPLMISTAHQLMRYRDIFDVMIIDEVDAFPFSADETLRFAVDKARKSNSALVYVTATPSDALKKKAEAGLLKSVRIPARYHRKPLPEPRFLWCGNWKKKLEKGKLPHSVTDWVRQKLQSRLPVFLFVPSVHVLKKTTDYFQKLNVRAEGVHAEDTFRKDKVKRFRDGRLDLLVTTTILERGVTVPRVQTCVLGAEAPIFTESALVQIAGRTGRHYKHFSGDVVMFHFGMTNGMKKAKKHIEHMNKLAQKSKLLD